MAEGRQGLLLPVGGGHLLLEMLDLNSSDKRETGDGCRGLLAFSPAPSMNINVKKWSAVLAFREDKLQQCANFILVYMILLT